MSQRSSGAAQVCIRILRTSKIMALAKKGLTMAANDALEQAQKHHQNGEFTQAVLLLRQFVVDKPGHAAAQCALGKSLKRMGRFAEAQEALEKAVEGKLDFAEAHYQLGLVLGQQ